LWKGLLESWKNPVEDDCQMVSFFFAPMLVAVAFMTARRTLDLNAKRAEIEGAPQNRFSTIQMIQSLWDFLLFLLILIFC
jgi:hypothetical protein